MAGRLTRRKFVRAGDHTYGSPTRLKVSLLYK